MQATPDGLTEWFAAQYRFSASAMLRAVSATSLLKQRPLLGQTIRPLPGSVLASPEIAAYDPDPDYFFHWLRDSAIVIDALRQLIEDGTLEASAIAHLADFVSFSLALCRLDGPSFLARGDFCAGVDPSFRERVRSKEELAQIVGDRALGEARYNADASFDLLKWSRPQNDGPALRALAVLRCLALDAFRARAGKAAQTLLRYDLDYTLAHWREPCYDLWEEVLGRHYYTRRVQAEALARGGEHFASLGDAARAAACREAGQELLAQLDDHFDPAEGVYLSRLPERNEPPGAAPARRLDIATVLAVIHADARGERHGALDWRMLATMAALERLFDAEYPINRARPASCAPALGRYAGDVYYSGGAYYFSTFGAAQFYYLMAEAAAAGAKRPIGAENRLPFANLLGEPLDALHAGAFDGVERRRLCKAVIRRGDMFMAMARRHTPASGELSEQFDQYDGRQSSAKNLAWSYAAFITAVATRRRACASAGV